MKDYDALSPEYKQLVDELADLEHKQWSHWVTYMEDNWNYKNLTRWLKQSQTPYTGLSEEEKESDREWAMCVLDILTKDMPVCRLCGHDPS